MCHKTMHHNGNLKGRKLVSDVATTLLQDMTTSWCRTNWAFPCVHILKYADNSTEYRSHQRELKCKAEIGFGPLYFILPDKLLPLH